MKTLNFLTSLFSSAAGRQSNVVRVRDGQQPTNLQLISNLSLTHTPFRLVKWVAVLCLLVTLGVGSVWGTPSVIYTLTPVAGSDNSYAGDEDIACEDEDNEVTITWNVTGNATMTPWRIGGKGGSNASSTATLVRDIYCTSALSTDDVSKVILSHGTSTISGTGWSINSVTLIVSTSSDGGGTVISSIERAFKASDTIIINRPAGKDWSSKYFTIRYNISAKGSSNKYLEFSGAEFYAESGGCTGTKLGTPVVTATPSSGQVVLTWPNVSNASSYKLKWNGGDWESAVSGVTKTGLTNGSTYTYQVQAIGDGDDYCDGDASASASVIPGIYYTVTWKSNGSTYTTTSVRSGTKPTFPDEPSSCDGTSTTFYGWAATGSTWSGKIDDISAKTIYTSASAMPDVSGTVTYHAVFAKATGSGTTTQAATLSTSAPIISGSGWATSTSKTYSGPYLRLDVDGQYVSFTSPKGAISRFQFTYKLNYSTSCSGHSGVNWWIGNVKFYASTDGGSNWTELTSKSINDIDRGTDLGTDIAVDYTDLASGCYNAIKVQLGKDCGNLGIKGLSATYSNVTYSEYLTSCCTALGTINGSVSWSNATTAVVSWNNLANVSSWTVKYKTHAAGAYTTWAGDQTVYTKSTTNDSRKVTITGLTACTDYDFQIIATPASGYCDKDETIEDSQTHNYTVTSTGVTNVTPSSDFPTTTCTGFSITSMTAADGYHLPTSITVTNADKTWNSSTGALTISNVTGNVTITITAELDACDDYSFFYGTTKGSENNFECFSQVGTSTTWLTGLWTIPSSDQWTYVGEPNWDPSPGKSANLQLSSMPYALNHANNLGSISSGVMEGAQGYIKISDDSTDPNRYVGFIPAGYVFRWGSGESWSSKPFTAASADIDEEDWNTALQTWTSSNADDFTYVGLKTSSGYVWANRSETRRPVFLKPNDTWKGDNAKFVMYYWDASSHTGYSAIMTDPDGDGIYEAWIPNTYTYTNVIFGRLNPVQVDPVVNWDNKWNKTVDLTLPSDKNLFTITGGSDQSYTGSWSLYDKKGTFHISANSNTNNWYCHFLPHHVLTYNANGGSGAPDVQSVAINASPCQITVAAGSGMTPPTGYSFIGWNPDESEADAGNVDSDYDPNDTPTMSGDITLYAVWQANSIALTLDKNNSDASGSSNGSGSIDYDATSGTITTAATRTGYSVEGYYSENTCAAANKVLTAAGAVVNSTVSGYTSSGKWARATDPTTLYTKWTANEYTISLDDQSATTAASISSITVTFNDDENLTGTVVATRPTKTGYQFGGYYTSTGGGGVKIIDADGTVVASVATYTDASKNWIKASNVDLYAYWLPIYAITWKVNNVALTGDALDGASTAVVSGGTISGVPSTAPADNTLNNCANKFMGWSTTDITKGSPVTDADDIAALGLFTEASGYTTAISGATTFYAVFAEEGGSGTYSDGTTHVWLTGPTYTYEDWGGTSTYSWSRNDNAELPTFKYTPIYGVKKVVLNVKQTQTAGSNTVAVSVGGTTIGSTQTIGSESGTSAFNMTFDNGTGTPLTGQVQIVLTNTSGSGTRKGSFYLNSITLYEGVQDIGYTNYVTQCADDQVRVTYDFNGGTGDDCTEGVTEKTANYTVCSTEPEKDYYTFAGWNDGTSTYSAGATGYNLQTNTTFTAQWTATSYDITYVLDGGTNDGDNPATYTVETSDITLKDATKGHSRFDGWFTDNGVWSEEVTTISNGSHGNITLYAKWTDRNEIKFYADASLLATIYRASDENLQASVTGQGSKPSDPSAPSACSSKVFKGWTETWFNDETDTEPADLNDATGTRSADKTYYAVWATRAGDPGSYTYSAYSTTCCSNEVTVSGGSPSNGTVTFDKSYVWTCKGDREIVMTIDPADGYQLTTFSVATGDGKVAAKSMSADVELNNNSSEPQEITLTFAQDADGAYDVTATFAEMTVTSWEWTYNSSALPDPIDVYVGQKKQIDVVMSPSGVLSSHKNNNSYTHSVNATYIANPNRAGAYFTFEGKAATESTPITLTHNDDTSEPKAFALTFNVRVKALPLVHFVDNIHNESFSDVVATVSGDKMTVNMVQSTPTHVDVAVPGTGNSCEKTHLHLIGWIRSDYSKVAAYMAGTGDAPTTEELSGAGSDYWFLPDADINVETFNGKTFYAVWAVEE